MKKTLFTLLAVGAFVFTSCNTSGNSTENVETTSNDSTSTSENKETSTDNLYTDVSTLKKAEEQLKNLPQFKGKDIKVFQKIYFYEDDRIIVDLQDPTKLENIDSYTFRNGKWEDPQAVQISGGGDLEANLFSLNEIKFETVSTIYKELQKQAKDIDGAKIGSGIYYNLNVMRGEKSWFTGIDGDRGSYSGYFNADGTLKEFKKN